MRSNEAEQNMIYIYNNGGGCVECGWGRVPIITANNPLHGQSRKLLPKISAELDLQDEFSVAKMVQLCSPSKNVICLFLDNWQQVNQVYQLEF